MDKLYKMKFKTIYPLYIAKALKKGRTEEEVNEIISCLSGYSKEEIIKKSGEDIDMETFF